MNEVWAGCPNLGHTTLATIPCTLNLVKFSSSNFIKTSQIINIHPTSESCSNFIRKWKIVYNSKILHIKVSRYNFSGRKTFIKITSDFLGKKWTIHFFLYKRFYIYLQIINKYMCKKKYIYIYK